MKHSETELTDTANCIFSGGSPSSHCTVCFVWYMKLRTCKFPFLNFICCISKSQKIKHLSNYCSLQLWLNCPVLQFSYKFGVLIASQHSFRQLQSWLLQNNFSYRPYYILWYQFNNSTARGVFSSGILWHAYDYDDEYDYTYIIISVAARVESKLQQVLSPVFSKFSVSSFEEQILII